AARAGGGPHEWIDHVRERGQDGIRGRAGAFLRPAQPVDRAALLARLDGDVCVLAVATGVHALYLHRDPIMAAAEIGSSQAVERSLRTRSQRLGLLAGLLQVSGPEAETLWGRTRWLDVAVIATRDLSVADLRERWCEMARADSTGPRLETTALAEAGIAPAPGLPDPYHVLDMVVDHAQRQRPPGVLIEAAVAATRPVQIAPTEGEPDPADLLPLFSHRELGPDTGR
ncbi:hypothetical protein, partial [Nocardia sp. NPDC058497]|uniref:hypothetical protein n=1 Tax=Nocardia sp. NPDC058497 TaxID=3346529 RepID=UPI00366856CE